MNGLLTTSLNWMYLFQLFSVLLIKKNLLIKVIYIHIAKLVTYLINFTYFMHKYVCLMPCQIQNLELLDHTSNKIIIFDEIITLMSSTM